MLLCALTRGQAAVPHFVISSRNGWQCTKGSKQGTEKFAEENSSLSIEEFLVD